MNRPLLADSRESRESRDPRGRLTTAGERERALGILDQNRKSYVSVRVHQCYTSHSHWLVPPQSLSILSIRRRKEEEIRTIWQQLVYNIEYTVLALIIG